MRSALLVGALLAVGAVLLSDTSRAHGGVYRGPGSGVPPGGQPGGAPTGAPSSGGTAAMDITSWQRWWSFNRDPFLNLKAAVHGPGVVTGSGDLFLGLGQSAQGPKTWRPAESVIRQKVVPALLAIVENASQKDLVSSALLALAKIGDESESSSKIADAIRGRLGDPNQEVNETAAVGLGILAHQEAAATLAGLLTDSPEARRTTSRQRIPDRTRAFAAYGLGMVGYRTTNEDVRRFVVQALLSMLETDDSASRDITTACLIALGLVRLTPSGNPYDPEADEPPARYTREGQIEHLLAFFRDSGNSELLRTYAAVPAARLLRGTHPSWHEHVAASLLDVLDDKKSPPSVEQACVQALGLIGDGDSDAIDERIRNTLMEEFRSGERLSRHLALASLARIGGRTGGGESPDVAAPEIRKFLLEILAHGKTVQRPWAAIALGMLERIRDDQGLETSKNVARAVRTGLEGLKSPLEAAGYCIALGLMRDLDSWELVLKRVGGIDDELRSHAAIALGLMDATHAIGPLREVVVSSQYRPAILNASAIALGMLGDKEVVPILVDVLSVSKTLATQAAAASSLGFIGDKRSIDPLLVMIADEHSYTDEARAFAAVALGIVCDKEPYPWNSKIAVDVNYWLAPPTLTNPATGTGVLDLL